MKDNDFNGLGHIIPEGYRIKSRREQLSKWYKPDLSIEDSSGKITCICECENNTARKGFLGGLIKAEHYYDSHSSNGIMVIVLEEKDNTTKDQIASHLRPYFSWVKAARSSQNGITQVLILTDIEYKQSLNAGEPLLSLEFRNRCIILDGGR